MSNHLIVLSAPPVKGYYKKVYQHVVAFHIGYAKAVLGREDDILILTNADTHATYAAELPAEILIRYSSQEDIWMRDFTTINPTSPVQFRYAPAAQGGSKSEAKYVQNAFNKFSAQFGLNIPKTDHILDGGNVVDNHENRAIVTDRFLKDNRLKKDSAKTELKRLLQVSEVAIIPAEDVSYDPLGHADGMVMWVSRDVVVVNQNPDVDLHAGILAELRSSFPGVTVVEVPCDPIEDSFDKKFPSATGIHVNSVVTPQNIYMPVFNVANDAVVTSILRRHTTKNIVPVDARMVAKLGGSVRCLSWQIGGNVAAVVKAALCREQV